VGRTRRGRKLDCYQEGSRGRPSATAKDNGEGGFVSVTGLNQEGGGGAEGLYNRERGVRFSKSAADHAKKSRVLKGATFLCIRPGNLEGRRPTLFEIRNACRKVLQLSKC